MLRTYELKMSKSGLTGFYGTEVEIKANSLSGGWTAKFIDPITVGNFPGDLVTYIPGMGFGAGHSNEYYWFKTGTGKWPVSITY